MKKIASQIKTINSDFSAMAANQFSSVVADEPKPTADATGDTADTPPKDVHYEKHFIVDDMETGTVVRKAAVHLGLLLDDGVEFATRLNPLHQLKKSTARPDPTRDGAAAPRALSADEGHHEIRYRQKINIQAHDGVILCANLFAPDTPDPGQRFPAIVFINSWCMDKHQYLLQARRFARHGYLVLSYSARGWGNSGGVVQVGGPEDMRDISTVIDWLIENTPVDAQNIGFSGISYGSGLSLLATAHDKRVKTAVCMSGWADLLESFWSEQTPRQFFAKLLVGSSKVAAKTDDTLDYMLSGLLNNQNLDDVKAWAKARSPATYLRSYNGRKPPIYLIQNFQDELFHPNSIVAFYNRLKGPKRLDLNLGTHGSAELSGILGLRNHLWMQAHAWFDHWLKGAPNQIMLQAPISCQFERKSRLRLSLGRHEGHRRNLQDWAATRQAMHTFYLVPSPVSGVEGLLAAAPSTVRARNTIISGPGSSRSTAGIPMFSSTKSAHLNMRMKLELARVPEKFAVLYQSEPMLQRMCILGTPELALRIQTSRPQVQLIAYLYEATQEGSARLITHGPMTRHLVKPNKPFDVNFELMTTCYEVPAGRHLVLVIDTSDLQYQSPTRDDFEVTFHYGDKAGPVLNIPMAAVSDNGS